jgi:Tetracyclin repressor-like, C-terminal domain
MRAGLVATQIMGLAVTRYILKVPPVIAMDGAQLVRLLGRRCSVTSSASSEHGCCSVSN